MIQGSAPYLILQTDAGSLNLSLTDSNCWTVGRGDENNFVIKDRCISRNHAMLQYTEAGDYYLIDLGSSNGGRKGSENCLVFNQFQL